MSLVLKRPGIFKSRPKEYGTMHRQDCRPCCTSFRILEPRHAVTLYIPSFRYIGLPNVGTYIVYRACGQLLLCPAPSFVFRLLPSERQRSCLVARQLRSSRRARFRVTSSVTSSYTLRSRSWLSRRFLSHCATTRGTSENNHWVQTICSCLSRYCLPMVSR
jgi:hypothetical protein